jgi:predicted nucleic acid-binding protein
MTVGCVVDASVMLSLVLAEVDTYERAQRVMTELWGKTLLVPAIWQAEVANVLLVKERQRRVAASFLRRALRHLEGLPIAVDVEAATATFERVVPLARRHQLTVYDATYLELALREGASLATFDGAIAAAAVRERVPVVNGA